MRAGVPAVVSAPAGGEGRVIEGEAAVEDQQFGLAEAGLESIGGE
jgi:hypothetical protein